MLRTLSSRINPQAASLASGSEAVCCMRSSFTACGVNAWTLADVARVLPTSLRPTSTFSTAASDQATLKAGSESKVEAAAAASDGPLPGDVGFDPKPHPSKLSAEKGSDYLLMHPVYTKEYMESVTPKHRPPADGMDRAAYATIQAVRSGFDVITGYGPNMNREKWLTRIVFLETVAGVPGIVGAMVRHLHSLRLMRRDHGWIHTLLEEAENERMHLMTFMQLKNPGWFFRTAVVFTQGIFCNGFFFLYLVSPTFCHRLVGYLEEEAVKTYTHLLHDLDAGKIPEWVDAPAPAIAVNYWKLGSDAQMRDLVLAVRADEACHSHVNHTFAGMKNDETNPFDRGSHQVP